jgi:hypothetical protein
MLPVAVAPVNANHVAASPQVKKMPGAGASSIFDQQLRYCVVHIIRIHPVYRCEC